MFQNKNWIPGRAPPLNESLSQFFPILHSGGDIRPWKSDLLRVEILGLFLGASHLDQGLTTSAMSDQIDQKEDS